MMDAYRIYVSIEAWSDRLGEWEPVEEVGTVPVGDFGFTNEAEAEAVANAMADRGKAMAASSPNTVSMEWKPPTDAAALDEICGFTLNPAREWGMENTGGGLLRPTLLRDDSARLVWSDDSRAMFLYLADSTETEEGLGAWPCRSDQDIRLVVDLFLEIGLIDLLT
jgi:hypothetical protein